MEDWQLGHRIEEPGLDTGVWWELHPVTVVRPAAGETTARFLCATCDEPVECVVSAATGLRRRRPPWVRWAAAGGAMVLGFSAVSYLFSAVVLAVSLEWWPTVALAPAGLFCGWLASRVAPYIHDPELPPDPGIRLVNPSPAHELRPGLAHLE